MATKPDFSQNTKETLAKRAGQICSNPRCLKPTSGPHTHPDKAVNLGEAAHIRGARPGSARYDADLTDKERSDISNGIWLCRTCAKLVDSDEAHYTPDLLQKWKRDHEARIAAGRTDVAPAAKEIRVKDGGTGQITANTGPGIGEDIEQNGPGPGERVVVEGEGIGEVITNTGSGIGKKITSHGPGPALDVSIRADRPVEHAAALSVHTLIVACPMCRHSFQASKVILGFVDRPVPTQEVTCPRCGARLDV
jgi:hypothetical protein